MAIRLIIPFWYLFSYAAAQQVGSFFTAIYLNGAPISSSQVSCSNMGQPSYCCASGQSCAWDDGGKVACCASGMTCQGTAYSSGAYSNGAGAGAGQYYTSSSSWYPQQQTATVYQSQQCGNCNCPACTTSHGNVVPIVPVTAATVLTSYVPTSYYTPPTSTYYAQTTPAVVEVTTNAACPGGYTTVTEANVGAPVRTVGCYVIIDSSGGVKRQEDIMILCLMNFVGIMMLVG